jgi:hypothetical protein
MLAETGQVPEYARAAYSRGWPVGMYVGALVWAFVTLHVSSHELAKNQQAVSRNTLRTTSLVVLLAVAALRLAWSVVRKESGKGWVFYVLPLLLAAPLWFFTERLLWWLAGSRLGAAAN